MTQQEAGVPRAQVSHRKLLSEVSAWAGGPCMLGSQQYSQPTGFVHGLEGGLRATLRHFPSLVLMLAVMSAVMP